ncbi:MAG: cytochrome c biogenesis protein CcsA, partial [Thermodesulfovibrionales bacterium]
RNTRVFPRLVWLVAGAFALHTLTIAARTAAQGHLPWAGDYENALMAGWFILVVTLFIAFRHPQLQALAVATVPASLLIMGFGVMRNPVLSPMAASLKSFWLYIHVWFAWLAYSAYTLAMAAGVVYLLKLRDATKGHTNSVYDRLPALDRLEELIFRYVVFGFIIDAIMIAAGAIWAKNLWGNYWSWDPVETWSLVSWLVYGITIHLRITMGWRGKKLAWLAIAALSTVIISFFGVTIVVDTSQHFFNVR